MKILKTAIDLLRSLESQAGDLLLNINTCGNVYFDRSGIRREYSDYETTAHTTVLSAIRAVKPSENDCVYVIGAGKGRAMCHFARLKVRRVVGIELSRQLCEIASENLESLRGRRSPFEVRNEDAVSADLAEGTIFYMFNPFDHEPMRKFLANLSGDHGPRDPGMKIIYLNPLCREVFSEFPFLKAIHDQKRLTGIRMIIYERVPY